MAPQRGAEVGPQPVHRRRAHAERGGERGKVGRQEVDALRAGGNKLTEAQKKALVEKMKAAYPTAGNEFMIALGADAVAGELARKQLASP